MANRISGPGVGLPLPQLVYPSNLNGGELNISTNRLSMAPGDAVPIPAGEWLVTLGKYSSLQYLDPVTTAWTLLRDALHAGTPTYVRSDGFNVRIANLTGCVVGASVTNGGSSWVQASTTVTPSTGNSTWQAIVGGALNTTVSVTAVGAGYGIAPLVYIDAPAAPGVQATAIAAISSGTVSGITVINQGAGYAAVPSITIIPNPSDVSTSITTATARGSLTGTGSITAVICTNSGASVATTMSLTVAGAGSNATVAALFLTALTNVTLTTAGTGYGTITELTTVFGQQIAASPAWTNPAIQLLGFVPRPARASLTVAGGTLSAVGTIYDAGLFLSTPQAVPVTNGIITTAATIALTLGGVNDSTLLQSL